MPTHTPQLNNLSFIHVKVKTTHTSQLINPSYLCFVCWIGHIRITNFPCFFLFCLLDWTHENPKPSMFFFYKLLAARSESTQHKQAMAESDKNGEDKCEMRDTVDKKKQEWKLLMEDPKLTWEEKVVEVLHIVRCRGFTEYNHKLLRSLPTRFHTHNIAFFDLDKECQYINPYIILNLSFLLHASNSCMDVCILSYYLFVITSLALGRYM